MGHRNRRYLRHWPGISYPTGQCRVQAHSQCPQSAKFAVACARTPTAPSGYYQSSSRRCLRISRCRSNLILYSSSFFRLFVKPVSKFFVHWSFNSLGQLINSYSLRSAVLSLTGAVGSFAIHDQASKKRAQRSKSPPGI